MKTTFLASILLLFASTVFAANLITIDPPLVSRPTGVTQAFNATLDASCDLSTVAWASGAGAFGTSFWSPAGDPTQGFFQTGSAGNKQPMVSYAVSVTAMCGGSPTTARAVINVYPLT